MSVAIQTQADSRIAARRDGLMKEVSVPAPEIGAIAVTRAILGAGLGLLLAGRLAPRRRRAVGAALMAVGILTTVPLALDLVRRVRSTE